MRKSILLLLTLLSINLIAYIPNSSIIYASKSIILRPAIYKSNFFNAADSDIDLRPRDFKIPDDEIDAVSYYNTSSNFGIPSSGGANLRIIPWKGPKLVVLDPGHGGYEPGACANGLIEKDINLDVSLRVNSILQNSGVLVLMTRKDDAAIEPRERIDMANSMEAALFVSIHSNWMDEPSLNGTMTLYYPSKALRAGYLNEVDYALIMQRELMKGLKTKDRGIFDRPNLTVLKHAVMPSVLIELGFMSNTSDAQLLASEDFKQKAAENIARGIINALAEIDKHD